MARRGSYSNKKKNDDLGCLFAIFEIIFAILAMLLTSSDPTARRIGLVILAVILALGGLTSSGVSMEVAVGAIAVIAVIIVIIFFAIDFWKEKSSKKKRHSRSSSSRTETAAAVSPRPNASTFEEQLQTMENEVRAIRGENVASPQPTITPAAACEEKYYPSVQDAVEKNAVPAGYQKIMIERIQQTDIRECPGLIWKDAAMLHVLPLLGNSKIYSWSLASIPVILFEKMTGVDVERTYQDMGTFAIAEEFEDVMPEYLFGSEGTYTGKFILPVGLEVTNTSGKILFEMLSAEFHMADGIMQSPWYAKEIKEIYQKHILWENGVIDAGQYTEIKEKNLAEFREREKNDAKYEQQIRAARELGIL